MLRRFPVRRFLHRFLALLLLFAQLATPLVLLAHPAGRTKTQCNGMCCRAHKSGSVPARPVSQPTASEMCDRGAARHLSTCVLPSDASQEFDAVFAPLPPAILAHVAWASASHLLSQRCIPVTQLSC